MRSARVQIVDQGRTVALIGMIVFHFARDLEMFGIWPPGATSTGIWYYLARLVAGSFLFLAGASLFLGHRTIVMSDVSAYGSKWLYLIRECCWPCILAGPSEPRGVSDCDEIAGSGG